MQYLKKNSCLLRSLFIIILALFLFKEKSLYSQFFEWGQDPSSIRWGKLETDNFRIIFPLDIGDCAKKMSFHLEESYNQNASQLKYKPAKIPVVLHNQNVISNGFVAVAPRRMEIFLNPDPQGYPGERLHQLAIHEQRHVTQIGKVNQGFTHVLSKFIGEQGSGYGAALLPFWFLEGDAVFAETSCSRTGRGRLPEFEKEIKAILMDTTEKYFHEKAFLGSYKDFVPDYYRYGYQMVSYARNKYGENFWPEAVNYTGRNSWMFFPFSYYLKKETGLTRKQLHNESMNFIKTHWNESFKKRHIEKYDCLDKQHKVYTSYSYPHIVNDSSIIALKSGLNIIPEFIQIQADGSETELFTPGSLNSGRISVHNNKILWDEIRPDVRWSNRNYSVLKEYNFETKKIRTLAGNTRYYSPSYSPGGDTIIAIEFTPEQKTNLIILSASDGRVVNKIQTPEDLFLQSPEWIKGTKLISLIAVNEQGKKIIIFDQEKESWSTIFNAGFFDIQDLKSYGDLILFKGSFNGIDDIYALNYKNNLLYRTTYSSFGAYQPDVSSDGTKLIFSNYTKNGSRVSKKDMIFHPVSLNELSSKEQPYFNTENLNETDIPSIKIPDNYNPEIKRYHKISSLFNFHSWLPFYIDYNNLLEEKPKINPGFSLTSQNILSTAYTSVGYEYANKEHFFHTSFTYKGILPVISISAEYGGKPLIFNDSIPSSLKVSTNQHYNFLTYIPFNLSSGKTISGIQPILKYSYVGNYFYYRSDEKFKKGMHFLETRLYCYSYLRTALRDLQPKWGAIIDGKITSAPFEKEQIGSVASLRSVLYLPGILKNQGLKLQFQIQNQKPEKYLSPNHISFPRGYTDYPALKLIKYSGDYVMPLLYPDLRIGPVIYLKRIYLSAFADYISGNDIYEIKNNRRVISDKNLFSSGAELYFEYHFLRFLFPFIQGIRISYAYENKKVIFENIFSIKMSRL